MSLTRKQQRRVKALTDQIGELVDTDRRFFARRPDRAHRIRRAFRQEIEVDTILCGIPTQPPEGLAYFILVRQILPGIRLRVLLSQPRDTETDVPEELVQALYAAVVCAQPKVQQIEKSLETAFRCDKGGV